MVEAQHGLERQLELIETHQQEVRFCFALNVDGALLGFLPFFVIIVNYQDCAKKHLLQVEKALESMEEEAEKLYREERPSLLEDEAAATRDVMYVT